MQRSGQARVRRPIVSMAAAIVALVMAGCTSTGSVSRQLGTIVGTIVVDFESSSGAVLSAATQKRLRGRHSFYRLGLRRNSFLGARSLINARRDGVVTPFAASLREGSYQITHLYLRASRGPDTSRALSALAGFNVALAIDVPVHQSAVTYVGRLKVTVPSRVQGTTSASQVEVEDASAADLALFAGIVRADRRGTRVELARVRVVDQGEQF